MLVMGSFLASSTKGKIQQVLRVAIFWPSKSVSIISNAFGRVDSISFHRLAILLTFVLALGSGCSISFASTLEKSGVYKWLPTESAPDRYPVRLIRGAFLLPDGRRVALPDRRDVANGWGKRGSLHILDDEPKPVPQRLSLEWFSYTENRFYKGDFALPELAIENLFFAGVGTGQPDGEKSSFERIIVGMAPGGLVSVWLAAGSEVVEVGGWHADVADLPWTSVLDNPDITREAFIDKVLEARLTVEERARLAREGVPTNLYTSYRTQYQWRPWVTGMGQALQIRISSLNGEYAVIGAYGPAVPREQRALPAEMELQWVTSGGQSKWAHIRFDEEETSSAFAELGQGGPNRQLALQLDTTADSVSVSLRDERFVLPLRKAHIEIFKDR